MTTSTADVPSPIDITSLFLMAGEYHCAATPTIITTVLGSCVAVCLWDLASCLGGMNHFVLPQAVEDQGSARYGETSIDQIIAGMERLGCKKQNLTAKIFGGSMVLTIGTFENNVGQKNVTMAMERLKFHRIPITARRTGGHSGMWIQFSTFSGQVLVRPLQERAIPGDQTTEAAFPK